jgi:hypothetical protein
MILIWLATAGLVSAVIPLLIFLRNLLAFRRLPYAEAAQSSASISVLIPARDEADSIGPACESVLRNRGVDLELIVLDDQSQDATAQIVEAIAARDPRVRLMSAAALPSGWCGKQHACHQLSLAARNALLLWMDADVRLADDALRRIALEMQCAPISLLSGFPLEQTGSFFERLLLPLIHFILLGYCPVWMMRRSQFVGLGAGCGQLFIAKRADYLKAGGHTAIRASLHDGIALPRAMRRAGFLTGIFDAMDVAECRMYRSASATWQGLLKNAGEGLATSRAIVPWTLILLTGQVVPPVLATILLATALHRDLDVREFDALQLCLVAVLGSLTFRCISAWRFRQPAWIVLLHPLAICTLLLIQWQAVLLRVRRQPTAWRGRSYLIREGVPTEEAG